jgi:hypothetical protein
MGNKHNIKGYPKKRLPHTSIKIVFYSIIVCFLGFLMGRAGNPDIIRTTPNQVPVFFTYTEQCETVCLSGDFNGWSPNAHCLKWNGDIWEIQILLSPGRYKYAFLVDGTRWALDPNAFLQEDDGFGMKNSVLIVE